MHMELSILSSSLNNSESQPIPWLLCYIRSQKESREYKRYYASSTVSLRQGLTPSLGCPLGLFLCSTRRGLSDPHTHWIPGTSTEDTDDNSYVGRGCYRVLQSTSH